MTARPTVDPEVVVDGLDGTGDSSDDLVETPAERDERAIAVPRPVDEVQASPFPWLMMLSPAVLGAGLVFLTGSTHALVFAALGPVLALGTVIDQSLQRRSRLRRDDARFERELDEAGREVEARLARERSRRLQRHPGVRELVSGRREFVVTDASDSRARLRLALGTTSVPSGIRLEATAADGDRRVAELVEAARVIERVPHEEDGAHAVFAGPLDLGMRAALGCIVDLAARVPTGISLSLSGSGAQKLVAAEVIRSGLHASGAVTLITAAEFAREGPGDPLQDTRQRDPAGRPSFEFTFVERARAAPGTADMVLELRSATDGTVRSTTGTTRVVPQLVSTSEFHRWARRHLGERRGRGIGISNDAALPSFCALDDLLRVRPPASVLADTPHLAAPVGAGESTPVWVDLVDDGPHAVVGGTTGTGKSELLRSWITALAARYPATYVSFLCIDFKGGATFDAIAELPHCVGVVTDLDGNEAVRVLAGLRAELRRREHELRRLAVRDISSLKPGTLERLVVVVDEFQALIDEHRDLHDAFADLAARGRSLGIHLVLCAQRPAGAARESLLANCTIRLSLRVTNQADSQAVIGSSDAASLPAEPRGRGIISLGGERRTIQVARLSDPLLRSTRQRRARELAEADAAGPRAPWLPPLPVEMSRNDFVRRAAPPKGGRIGIALLDEPEQQRQPTLELDVRGGAHLLVVGPSGSGKSSALASIAQSLEAADVAVETLPSELEGAWDTATRVRARTTRSPLVLIVDDLDERGSAFGEDHRQAWLAMLVDVAKLGGSRGVTLVASATRAVGEISAVAGLARDTLRLGSPSRHEFVLSGGEAADYRAALPPGRGVVRGLLAHVPLPDGRSDTATPAAGEDPGYPELDLGRLVELGGAIVSRRPHTRIAQFAARGYATSPVPRPGAFPGTDPIDSSGAAANGERAVTMGEPDLWQQSYGALARFAARGPVVFDDVPATLGRSLLPGEGLTPPVANPESIVLVREVGGQWRRFAWPAS